MLSECVLLGQFKPLLALSMPVAPVLVITTPQQNQQNWLVIYTFNILSSIFLPNIQALQAQLEQLRLCWVCQWVGDHQESSSMCSQERHGGRTLLPDQVASDSTSSLMYMASEPWGKRTSCPYQVSSSSHVWEASGIVRLGEASSCYHSARAVEPSMCTGPETHTVPVHMPHTQHSELCWHWF